MGKGDTLNTLTNYRPNNLVLNGALDHWERGTSFVGISSGSTKVADRWYAQSNAMTPNYDIDRSTDVPDPNFSYSMKITNQSAIGSIPSGASNLIFQPCYSQNAYLYRGKKCTFSCWVKTNKAGTYHFFMWFGNGSVIYQRNKHVALSSSVWTKVSFKADSVLPDDFTTTSNVGGYFGCHFATGTSSHGADSDDWQRFPDVPIIRGSTGMVNFLDTVGNELYMTGVMVTDSEDENAPFQYHGADVLDELDKCRMYFQRIHYPLNAFAFTGIAASTTTLHGEFRYLRPMLKNPTPSVSSTGHFRIYNNILGNTTLTTFQSYFHTAEQCLLNAIGPGTITGGESYVLQSTNSGAYIDLDAEI